MYKEALIRLASTMTSGSIERKLVLAAAQKTAKINIDLLHSLEKRFIAENKTVFGGRATDQFWLNGWHSGLDIIWPSPDEYTVCSRFEISCVMGSTDFITFIIFDENNEELGYNLVDVTRFLRSNPNLVGSGEIALPGLDKKEHIDWPEDEEFAYEIFEKIVKKYAADAARAVKKILL